MEQTIKNALTEEIVTLAGAMFGVDRKDIKTLGGFENFVYEYEKDKNFYILRLVHSSHRAHHYVQAELEFIDYLAKNGASVSTVVPSIKGNFIEEIKDEFGGYFSACVFTKAKGTYVKRDQIDANFNYQFGMEVARLHKLTKSYQPKQDRYHFFEEDFIEIGKRSLPKEDLFMIQKAEDLMEYLKGLERDKDSYGLIHTDLHFGNMYYNEGVFTFFDWDDSAYKHFISDIAIIIFYQFGFHNLSDAEKEEKTKAFLNDFMRGYNTINKLDKKWFLLLNKFLKLRELVLYLVLHGSGEEFTESEWGKNFINTYRNRIINDTPFFNLDKVLEFDKWNT